MTGTGGTHHLCSMSPRLQMKAPFLGGTSNHSPFNLTCSPGTSSWPTAQTIKEATASKREKGGTHQTSCSPKLQGRSGCSRVDCKEPHDMAEDSTDTCIAATSDTKLRSRGHGHIARRSKHMQMLWHPRQQKHRKTLQDTHRIGLEGWGLLLPVWAGSGVSPIPPLLQEQTAVLLRQTKAQHKTNQLL